MRTPQDWGQPCPNPDCSHDRLINCGNMSAMVIMALKMLLVKVALSDMSFVLWVTGATVLAWLRRAAQKAHEIYPHLLRDLPKAGSALQFFKKLVTALTKPAGSSYMGM